MKTFFIGGLCLAAFLLSSCRPSPVTLAPLPARIETIEGYASLKISTAQESTRSKFAFFFHLPHRGRIEVVGALGKVLYRILIYQGDSFFIVPSKRVYWRGEEEEIIDRFLGFRLDLKEMISLISGKWDSDLTGKKEIKSWSLEKDQKGRITSGWRRELWFEVKGFIDETPFARRLIFGHALSSGELKILSIGLNNPPREGLFSRQFMEKYVPKTWEEIQELFNNAR